MLATAVRSGNIAFTYNGGPKNYPATQVVVSVTSVQPPTGSFHVNSNGTGQFAVTISGAHDTGVIWGDTCTYTTCGTLTPGNPVPETTPITFTAPANIAGSAAPHTAATDTVTAVSHVDPTKIAPVPAIVGIINDPPVVPVPSTDVSTQDPTIAIFNVVATDTPTDSESDIATNTINWGLGGDVPFNGSLAKAYTDSGAPGTPGLYHRSDEHRHFGREHLGYHCHRVCPKSAESIPDHCGAREFVRGDPTFECVLRAGR